MSSNRSFGCTTHILIIGGLLCVAVAYGVVRNWDTFSLMVDNLTIMNEQASQAEALHSPAELVDYLAAHPERASLVAYDVGARTNGIFYHADAVRPVTGVPSLLLLAEYARRVDEHSLDPKMRVDLDSVDVLSLPGISLSQHRRARSRLIETDAVRPDSTVAVRDIGRSAFRWNDPAATDWLLGHLGPGPLQEISDRLGVSDVDPPIPSSGIHLLWSNHEQTSSPKARADSLAAIPVRAHTRQAYRALHRLHRDSAFRHKERRRLSQQGSGLSLRHQRTLAQHTSPRGTASAYADLLRRVSTNTLLSDSVSTQMQEHLERSIKSDSVGIPLRTVASVGGATPGLISLAGYARPKTGGTPRIVVLFLEQLPMAVFYHLLQTSLDKGLFLRLMGDDAFFSRVRNTLEATPVDRDTLSAYRNPEHLDPARP